jgi:photosynthetic reaction center H subunit
MQAGAIAGYIDVAQVMLYLFWVFFAGLIYYLLRENKREGYPLESDRSSRVTVQGWPSVPSPKTFKLSSGETVRVPAAAGPVNPVSGTPTGNWLGAPLMPTGNPMLAGIGPGSYAQRADRTDKTFEGEARIVPLRAAPGFGVAKQDPDPRGKEVIGADGRVGGVVRDLWVDRAENLFRYLEVEVGSGQHSRRVLLPINFARVSARAVQVNSVLGAQFAQVPATRHADQVTLLEEEKIMAYYGAGTLYAEASRQEPLL